MKHSYVELSETMAMTDCLRCGYTYEFHTRYFYREQSQWWLCKSCKAQPVTKCQYGSDWCVPWQGEFDLDLMVCLDDDGKPYKRGPRTCGHADCVRSAHLVWG